jgi:hypothetical protein
MKLLTESFFNIVDNPSAFTSRLQPPAKEHESPEVALVTDRVFLSVAEISA